MVPDFDPGEVWPTLGFDLADWLEDWLVFGPGDVRGEPYRLDHEKRGVLARMYEVHPLPETKGKREAALRRFKAGEAWRRGDPMAGRRRFKRTGISVRKGWAKTELLAGLAAAELHPDAPVRCVGWTLERGEYVPVGAGVRDPYIPLVAYTEEQSEELAFGALRVMVAEGPLADDFQVGVDVVHVIGPNGKSAGKCVALAAAPDARDGARTTFQGFDETHRQDSDRLKHAHETMLANVPKRLAADAHSAEVTTSYEPGKQSVAEGTHEYAKLVAQGKVEDRLLFYYHREAGPEFKIKDEETGELDRAVMEAAVLSASGPAAEFTDVDYIVSLGLDPQVDLAYWERVWLNRVLASGAQFFDLIAWEKLQGNAKRLPPARSLVALGFDGARSRDSTGIVGTEVETGRQFRVAYWEAPRTKDGKVVEGWEVPIGEVDAAMDEAFARWDAFLYADPYWWEDHVAKWTGKYGTRRVGKKRRVRVSDWPTNRTKEMANALRAYRNAIAMGELWHDGDPELTRHLANARGREVNFYDEQGNALKIIGKSRPDSPDLIDLAMCSCLSWECARDLIKAGLKKQSKRLTALA
jgi:phage terminase large subunit-like protein